MIFQHLGGNGFVVFDENFLDPTLKCSTWVLWFDFDWRKLKSVSFSCPLMKYGAGFLQALPYIRCIGESWPMTKERAYFEALALREHGGLSPDHVPEVYHFDRTMSLIGMRYLEPPHIILRKGLIAGIEYPLLADHMSDYIARTLFFTSLLYRNTTDHKRAGMWCILLIDYVLFSHIYCVLYLFSHDMLEIECMILRCFRWNVCEVVNHTLLCEIWLNICLGLDWVSILVQLQKWYSSESCH